MRSRVLCLRLKTNLVLTLCLIDFYVVMPPPRSVYVVLWAVILQISILFNSAEPCMYTALSAEEGKWPRADFQFGRGLLAVGGDCRLPAVASVD